MESRKDLSTQIFFTLEEFDFYDCAYDFVTIVEEKITVDLLNSTNLTKINKK
ncbi:MAG: hypothetical protein QW724_06635 [Nitrososphaerota archaeon]